MGLGYTYQDLKPITLIGTKTAANVITGSALTGTASDNRKAFDTSGMAKVSLSISYALGAAETANVISIVVETSGDGTNWYNTVNNAVSAGATTITQATYSFTGATATAPYNFQLPLDTFDKFMRLSCTESGVAANAGTVYIEAIRDGAIR